MTSKQNTIKNNCKPTNPARRRTGIPGYMQLQVLKMSKYTRTNIHEEKHIEHRNEVYHNFIDL